MVALGHGRDSIGIDIDSNADLALGASRHVVNR
jgi:hypothetical protein